MARPRGGRPTSETLPRSHALSNGQAYHMPSCSPPPALTASAAAPFPPVPLLPKVLPSVPPPSPPAEVSCPGLTPSRQPVSPSPPPTHSASAPRPRSLPSPYPCVPYPSASPSLSTQGLHPPHPLPSPSSPPHQLRRDVRHQLGAWVRLPARQPRQGTSLAGLAGCSSLPF